MNKTARYFLIAAAAIFGAVVGVMASQGSLGNPLVWIVLFFAIVGVMMWLGLRGNKGLGVADDATRARALAGGETRLIVVREGFVGKLSGIDVLIDGVVATQLKSPRFAVVPLAPGRHRVEAKAAMKTKPLGPVDLDLAPGETAVVRIAVELGDARLEREVWTADLSTRLAQIPMVAS